MEFIDFIQKLNSLTSEFLDSQVDNSQESESESESEESFVDDESDKLDF